jgi:myo-inositol 2-dehydrogenase/D-chiro-inositol 1-dehydrogenase
LCHNLQRKFTTFAQLFTAGEPIFMIRFGVLGAGRIGKVHAGTIARLSNSSVALVADAVPEAAAALAQSVGAKVASVDEVIGADVDAILICTPTDTHADLIEKAVQSGKHVLCEKPVSLSVERIQQALPIVEKAGKAVMIGFNRRFDPNFGSLQKRLRDKEIGDVELVTIISRDPAPPPVSYIERSGGLFRDMMIHDFDMARFLVGEEFVSVHALGAALVDRPSVRRATSTRPRCRCRRPRERSRSSRIPEELHMVTTSASKCMARRACCAPTTCR